MVEVTFLALEGTEKFLYSFFNGKYQIRRPLDEPSYMIDAKVLLNESSYLLTTTEYLAIFEAVFSGRHIYLLTKLYSVTSLKAAYQCNENLDNSMTKSSNYIQNCVKLRQDFFPINTHRISSVIEEVQIIDMCGSHGLFFAFLEVAHLIRKLP